MIRLILTTITALMLLTSTAQAQNDDKNWGLISTLDTGVKIHGRFNSFERYDGAGTLLIRFSNKNQISFYIVGMSDTDCDTGYGQITFFDTSWKLLRKEQWVSKGGNGLAHIGDLICLLINKKRGADL